MGTLPAEIEALRSLGEAQRADEYVQFWPAGSVVRGAFSCVACGRTVVSTHDLPPCPSCNGRLWEEPSSSPFGRSQPSFAAHLSAYERSNENDLDRTAAFVRGAFIALVAGPVLWLFLAASAYVLLR